MLVYQRVAATLTDSRIVTVAVLLVFRGPATVYPGCTHGA
jgi:hypothetical protein